MKISKKRLGEMKTHGFYRFARERK